MTTDTINQYFSTVQSGQIYRCVIETTEKMLIEKALAQSSGNQLIAARILGLNRNTLRTKIKKLKIDFRGFKL
ncbi:MAG: helix-turn-helix domain-containing protein [Candidatus Omnitrophota bacterium]